MKQSTDKAQASSTKQFFVSMLTRDVTLDDAILDLDNYLNGLAKDDFSIKHNCGIPRNVAINHSFKMEKQR